MPVPLFSARLRTLEQCASCKIHCIARRCRQPLTSHTRVTPSSFYAGSLLLNCSKAAALFSPQSSLALATRARPHQNHNDFTVCVRCDARSVVDGCYGHETHLDVPFVCCGCDVLQ